MQRRPLVSIVVPVFNEIKALDELVSRVDLALKKAEADYELLFINNASTDGTTEALDDKAAADRRISHILMSRNFGPTVESSILAGLDFARGDAVIVLYGDLQDPPELIPELLREWRRGFRVVHAVQASRDGDSLVHRTLVKSFYRTLRKIADVDLPSDAGDFKLIDRRVVDVVRSLPERERYFRGLVAWVGFEQTSVAYVRQSRTSGESKASFFAIVRTAFQATTGFSVVPLRAVTWMGFAALCLSAIYGVALAVMSFVGNPIRGLSTAYAFGALSIGLNLFAIGMVGEYVGKILSEVKSRPTYLVDRVVHSDE